MTDPLPDPATPFGARMRARLSEEIAVWLTTVGANGTPQPNPVWFVWDGATSVVVYNRADAHRLENLRRVPRWSMNFDGNGRGGDVVVLTGSVAAIGEAPAASRNEAYLAKYRESMTRVGGSPEQFDAEYPVPLRLTIERVRGF
jgi:PPOX class probable F420-dependent enzyme